MEENEQSQGLGKEPPAQDPTDRGLEEEPMDQLRGEQFGEKKEQLEILYSFSMCFVTLQTLLMNLVFSLFKDEGSWSAGIPS